MGKPKSKSKAQKSKHDGKEKDLVKRVTFAVKQAAKGKGSWRREAEPVKGQKRGKDRRNKDKESEDRGSDGGRKEEASSGEEDSDDEFLPQEDDDEDEDDMTIDEETERRESRQVKLQEKKPLPKKVKDRLIDACNHGQKRYLFNMEKIEKKYARLTKDQHVGTAILFDVKDGKWKFGEEELRMKDAAGYINNIARKNNQIGFANISAPCNSEVLKDQVSSRALKRIQMLDQKFNERLDLEKRGAMVVWGKNKEVAEPNRNGRVDWQRASVQPHIIRETETIEFPSFAFDADYARLFEGEKKKKNDGLAIEMEQLSIGECNQFFLPVRSPPKKLSAPALAPKPEVVDTDVPLPIDVQVECEIDFPQDENVQSNEDRDRQKERKPLTMRQLMTPVQEEEKEAEQSGDAEDPNETVPETPHQSQILDRLNEETASPTSFPMPSILSIATPESRLSIGSSAASQNRKRRRTADEMMIEDARQLLSPQRKVKREEEQKEQEDNMKTTDLPVTQIDTNYSIHSDSLLQQTEIDDYNVADLDRTANVTIRRKKKKSPPVQSIPTPLRRSSRRSNNSQLPATPVHPPSISRVSSCSSIVGSIDGNIGSDCETLDEADNENARHKDKELSLSFHLPLEGEALWFQTLDNITDIFSDSSELKTVFGVKRESIPSVLLNCTNPIELWINTPSLIGEVDEKFDDFDKRIRRMHAQAKQTGMNSLAGYIRQ
ncbi:hypothetical protein WR25_06551 [Diploscapter pachys]|uniref:Uncharacterized protein n=1 Tax=Diploscapter pachys TaxID=2018661 RepID=A0A2A2LW17_9BILA|nr:hypothetical protein WR25_06551 [Diploscapter pachys]